MMVSSRTWRAALMAALALLTFGDERALVAQQQTIDPALLNAYRWRSIGPDRGGRSIAVSGEGRVSSPPDLAQPAGESPVGKTGVVRAVIGERPLEDLLVEPLGASQIGHRDLDVVHPLVVGRLGRGGDVGTDRPPALGIHDMDDPPAICGTDHLETVDAAVTHRPVHQEVVTQPDGGEVVVRVGGVRIEIDRLLELLDRLVQPPAIGQFDAARVVLVGERDVVLFPGHEFAGQCTRRLFGGARKSQAAPKGSAPGESGAEGGCLPPPP